VLCKKKQKTKFQEDLMEAEETKEKKTTSRKWVVTIWALVVGTAIVGFGGFCSVKGLSYPEGFVGLATLLFSTGIAYIGGNVWQKQILHKEVSE
jgi:hypothetical protein